MSLTPEIKADYFLLMPEVPYDGKQLFPAGAFSYGGQLNAAGFTTMAPPPPYVVLDTADKAHAQAQKLAKQYNCQYYVTKVRLMGTYVPPPAEWKPVFEPGLKPTCICQQFMDPDPACPVCSRRR